MRYLPPLLFLPVLLALACRAADRGAEPAVDGAGVAVDPASVPGRITLELWQLRPGVTLADWKSANPEDAVRGDDPLRQALAFGEWCAVALHDFTAGDRIVTRRAYFYPPPAPLDRGNQRSITHIRRRIASVEISGTSDKSIVGVRLSD